MPLKTDLNISPFFDDFAEENNYYRILFRPEVSVQVRELNQLQSILQNQIERFGGHIFKNGTVLSGCGFQFYPNFDYIKINDTNGDAEAVSAESIKDFFVKNSNNTIAIIEDAIDGFESKNPDLNTLYIRYISSGANGTTYTFNPGDVVTVYSNSNPVERVTVLNGGSSFSNSDPIVVTPAVTVNVSSGTFANGDSIYQTIDGVTANATVVTASAKDTNNTQLLILKPFSGDLANASANNTKWTFTNAYNLSVVGGGAVGNVTSIVGAGADAVVVTDGVGVVTNIIVTDGGEGYSTNPIFTIRSIGNDVGLSALNLAARNYKMTVTVSNLANSVGQGYAFGVTEGQVYQSGQFLRVDPQRIVVSKYNTSPNNVVVGFNQVESIVNSSIDTALLDNASGTLNQSAPGAFRLQITPTLEVHDREDVLDEAAENKIDGFMILAEFDDGNPTKQYRTTQYSRLGDEMAQRDHDAHGNYVVDPFMIGTKDKSSTNNTNFDVVVDPGYAYINGHRVQTFFNATLNGRKGTATTTANNKTGSFNFGNYVYVRESFGQPAFSVGQTVHLKANAVFAVTFNRQGNSTIGLGYANTTVQGANVIAQAIGNSGANVGTAVIRGWEYDQGAIGTGNAQYRVYLYNIKINPGFTFRDSKTLVYNSGVNATSSVADLILEKESPSATSNGAILKDGGKFSTLIFPTGYDAVQTVTLLNYKYRDLADDIQTDTNGDASIVKSTTGEAFPYTPSSSLTTEQKETIIVTPKTDILGPNVTTAFATNYFTVGNSTSLPIVNFPTTLPGDIQAGDYFYVGNTTSSTLLMYRVSSVLNATAVFVSGANLTIANATVAPSLYRRVLPGGVPVPMDRSYRIANLSANGTTLNFNVKVSNGVVTQTAANLTVTHTISVTDAAGIQPSSKTLNRNVWVKINTSTHAANTSGPWSLGVPGGLRLRKVYKFVANSTVTLTTANSTNFTNLSTDITRYFFIDDGQNADYYGLSHLVKNSSDAEIPTGSNDGLLVNFDYVDPDVVNRRFFTKASYSIDDNANLASSTGTMHTVELPEFKSSTVPDQYYDLRDCIDFRPSANQTANATQLSSTLGSVTDVNPSNTITFDTDAKYFPAPDEDFTYNVSYYLGHVDRVILDQKGNFQLLEGANSYQVLPPPTAPESTIAINNLAIPPYPSIVEAPHGNLVEFLDKKVGNATGPVDERRFKYAVSIPQSLFDQHSQPVRYTMEDIGQLEQRIKILEYYTTLSLLESKVLDALIPSSANSSIARFKNGFFVDDFDSPDIADLTNPEFRGEIDTTASEFIPGKKAVKINMIFNEIEANTQSSIFNIHRFADTGVKLTSKNRSANTDIGDYSVILPFDPIKVIAQEKTNAATPKPIPGFKFTGVMTIKPNVLDIVKRVRTVKR